MGTTKEQGATTYTLRNEGNEHYLGSTMVRRLKNNQLVSTKTLDTFCKILKCDWLSPNTYPTEKEIKRLSEAVA